jgi:hypothetical protein
MIVCCLLHVVLPVMLPNSTHMLLEQLLQVPLQPGVVPVAWQRLRFIAALLVTTRG